MAADAEMSGAQMIAAERHRQVSKKGYDAKHDDEHEGGSLALAAALYAAPIRLWERHDYQDAIQFDDPWPWDREYDKRPRSSTSGKLLPNYYCHTMVDEYAQTRAERIRQLVVAGALLAAEIDRLKRLPPEGPEDE